MYIIPDTRDLIELLERNKPVGVEQFREVLNTNGHSIVLSYSNVAEFVRPLLSDNDFLRMRAKLNDLESLPLVYIRESTLAHAELALAVDAFKGGDEPTRLNPYVSRWDEVITPFGNTATKIFLNFRLHEIVSTAWKQNALHLNMQPFSLMLVDKMARERALPARRTRNLFDAFLPWVLKTLQDPRIATTLSPGEANLFARAVYENPFWCPGMRLAFEIYHAVRVNSNDPVQDGDILDIAHLTTLPYVDALTADARMIDYAKRALRKLSAIDRRFDFQSRLFPNLRRLIGSLA